MEYSVQVLQVEPQLTAVVRRQAQISELSKVIPQGCGEAWNFVRAAKLPRPGRNVAVYLDHVMNIEVGVEVSEPFTGNGQVFCSKTPEGLAVTTAHIGPYHKLKNAYDAVDTWCQNNGYALLGPAWEVYGHWTDDETRLRTDVYRLVEKR